MAQRRRRKYGYKFTEKTQSKKGIVAFILAVLSIAIFIYVIVNSFHHGGNGSMYLGSAGVSSMLVALVAVVLSIEMKALRFSLWIKACNCRASRWVRVV